MVRTSTRHGVAASTRSGHRMSRGFTLVEMMISLSITSLLFVAMGSTVLVAARAMPEPRGPLTAMHASSSALDVLSRDLALAGTILEASATHIEVKMPDLDADNVGDIIRYEWSGTAGDPLTRRVGAGAPVTLVEDVRAFSLSYATRDETRVWDEDQTTRSGEMLLAYFTSFPALALPSNQVQNVDTSRWLAQRFVIDQVALPANTTAVGFTRVELTVRRAAGGGAFEVSMHRPVSSGSSDPASSSLGSVLSRPWSSMPSTFTPTTFTFAEDVRYEGRGTLFFIVTKGTAANSADVRYFNATLASISETYARLTSDGGATWTPTLSMHTNCAPFAIYGYYETTETVNMSETKRYVRRIGVQLRAGEFERTRLDTSVAVMNEPELP